MARIIVLKGDILTQKKQYSVNRIVVCTETTCSESKPTFKAVDVNTGDILDLDFNMYEKSKSNKLTYD